MENLLPKIKTIRVMLCNMGDQQEAVFRMAFKMHNTTNYEIVAENADTKPDLVLVDTDTPNGFEIWQECRQKHPDTPVAMFGSSPPSVSAPYLPKPIKFDTLFPILRSLSQGGGIYDPNQASNSAGGEGKPSEGGVRKTTIRRFNPNKGLLGALKFAGQGNQDIAILHNGKPVLIVFPNIQRVLLTVNTGELEKLCKDDNLPVVCKAVPDNPQWKEKAKVTIMSCLWQMAIWTAQGRLIYPMTPQTVFTLKRWPNLTRLAHVPESMRLSAFLTKTSVNLNILYKVMPLEMPGILNYLAATHVTGFLATDAEFVAQAPAAAVSEQMNISSDVPNTPMAEEAQKAANPSKEQPRGLLQRLMRRLMGNS